MNAGAIVSDKSMCMEMWKTIYKRFHVSYYDFYMVDDNRYVTFSINAVVR